MLNVRSRLVLFFLLTVGLFLLYTDRTDADLVAERMVTGNKFSMSTLQLLAGNSYNFVNVGSFFNVLGILPGGFEIHGLRIKKDGKIGFKYSLLTRFTGGDQNACETLQIQALNNWSTKYDGKLLNLKADSDMGANSFDDWVIVVKLPSGATAAVANKTCNFELVAKTWKNSSTENRVGFWSERVLTNIVTIASWQ